VHDHDLLSCLSRRFNIHPLVVADIETTEQRTKLDVFEDALFLVSKMIYPESIKKTTHVEQISFYLKENILITFQEKPNDIFEPIKSSSLSLSNILINYLLQIVSDKIKVEYVDLKSIIYFIH
jgi:magnesium transporter